ncbi:PhzF family phenazine biosynthesis protein [uncultured Maricaulis sp.]|uniref:PhzF family phenazine biosynthesis protein n=1 Tax=uncultured Maricaulis sp. TaxID=174710 RepID=UPI0030DB087B|tara:strand:+ start:39164 stop:40072 length:909 start_codon:yes stop_codon:yes gene_type:complete
MPHPYLILDVFTDQAFSGNPLAVVFEADDLDEVAMQVIAAEFNLSETVFITEPKGQEADYGLRIFTPKTELPFAGHPTVGAAVALALQAGGEPGKRRRYVLEETVGDVTTDARYASPVQGSARFFAPRLPEHLGELPELEAIVEALGLKAGDYLQTPVQGGIWSAGVPYAIVPVRFAESMADIRLNTVAFDEAFGGGAEPVAAFVVAKASSTEHTTDWRARMFAPNLGLMEDPATGSAAAAFAGLLAEQGGLGDGDHSVSIYQGLEMGRPSHIRMLLRIEGGKLTELMIGGEAVKVAEGVLL